MKRLPRGRAAWAVALTALLLTSCDFPADPEGTLDRVSGETLRVGVIHDPPSLEDVPEGVLVRRERPF